jgi:acetyl esterase/lipase
MVLALTLRVAASALRRPRTVQLGDDRNQVAELYLPAGPPPPEGFAVAVLLHGGYWRTQYGKLTCRPAAAQLRRLGWAVWNVEYRRIGRGRGGGGGWPQTFEDVAAAVDALADLSSVHGIDAPLDLRSVVVLGHSAGGQLALWAAGRGQLSPRSLGAEPRVRPTAVVGLAPVTDMTAAGEAAVALLGGDAAAFPERWVGADPTRAAPPDVPTLIVHPQADQTIPVVRSRIFVERCRAAGADVTLADPPGEGHQHVILPGSRSWAAVEEFLAQRLMANGPQRRDPA